MNVRQVDTDVLIIGSGIAGFKAALEIAKLGKRTILASKSPLGKATNTTLGGGGFACSSDSFSPKEHFDQTMDSGRMINDRSLVDRFTTQARGDIEGLAKMGLNGEFHATGFRCRSPYLLGGPMVSRVLAGACREADIGIFENIMITDLIVAEDRCRGALGFQRRTGEWYGFRTKAVILATGGAGGIYAVNDNAPGVTGDGYAMALEAGLELIDMEFVQFYSLVFAGSGRARMLILPFFADAGKIVNRKGEDIKKKYDLNKKPVAIVSRDRLAQALYLEIIKGNSVDGALLLDMTNSDKNELPYGDALLKRFKKKIRYDSAPVKITPACHHTMGGIPIDADGRTTLKGLYAAGEVVGGIHGANRMGANAFSEALVFGGLAARTASNEIESETEFKDFKSVLDRYITKWNRRLRSEAGPVTIPVIMEKIKQILWKKAGIVRNETELNAAIDDIEAIFHQIETQSVCTPSELGKFVACRNAALTGMAIAVSALKRKESRGSHFREDFPSEESDWIRHVHVRLMDGRPQVGRVTPIL